MRIDKYIMRSLPFFIICISISGFYSSLILNFYQLSQIPMPPFVFFLLCVVVGALFGAFVALTERLNILKREIVVQLSFGFLPLSALWIGIILGDRISTGYLRLFEMTVFTIFTYQIWTRFLQSYFKQLYKLLMS